ncbi:hypothetical protein BFP70_11125 [Thioclava sp. SK-1]|nr:hypothetical protein BFP70_11125 [Thioclava sp. SK-1]
MLSPLAFALAFGAYAQEPHYKDAIQPNIIATDSTGVTGTADAAPSTAAFKDARDEMLQETPKQLTGDVDRDFVKMMIPEHRSILAMAQVVRDYGEDPALRSRAGQIIAREQAELDWMIAWYEAHGTP